MSNAGLLDCLTLSKLMLPHLNPFNGTSKHSIVVMENAPIHHVDGIVDMIQLVGAMVMFLPPYFPDFNPIELLFWMSIK